MNDIVEIRAMVRREMLDRVVHGLREAGLLRLSVTRLHALGARLDPSAAHLAAAEGAEEMETALVQFVCAGDRCAMYTELIARAARTGRLGDGYVTVTPVKGVVNIRTGAEGLEALV